MYMMEQALMRNCVFMVKRILEATLTLSPEVAEGKKQMSLTRIDEKLGEGAKSQHLLKAAVLLGSRTENEKVEKTAISLPEAYGRQ